MLEKRGKMKRKGEDTRPQEEHGAEKGKRTQGETLYNGAGQPEKEHGHQQWPQGDPGKQLRNATAKGHGGQGHDRLKAGNPGGGHRPPPQETRRRQRGKEKRPRVRRRENEIPARPPGPADTGTQSVAESGRYQGIDISRFDHYTVAIELSATACLLTLE